MSAAKPTPQSIPQQADSWTQAAQQVAHQPANVIKGIVDRHKEAMNSAIAHINRAIDTLEREEADVLKRTGGHLSGGYSEAIDRLKIERDRLKAAIPVLPAPRKDDLAPIKKAIRFCMISYCERTGIDHNTLSVSKAENCTGTVRRGDTFTACLMAFYEAANLPITREAFLAHAERVVAAMRGKGLYYRL